jgi:hypothetical protein
MQSREGSGRTCSEVVFHYFSEEEETSVRKENRYLNADGGTYMLK